MTIQTFSAVVFELIAWLVVYGLCYVTIEIDYVLLPFNDDQPLVLSIEYMLEMNVLR